MTLLELRDHLDLLFNEPLNIELLAEEKNILKHFLIDLAHLSWTKEHLEAHLKTFLEKNNLKMSALGKPLRIALVGTTNAPGIIDLLLVIGDKIVLERINKAIL